MSEEKTSHHGRTAATFRGRPPWRRRGEIERVPTQVSATPGLPERKAVARRQARVRENLHTLRKNAQEAILNSLEGTHWYQVPEFTDGGDGGRHHAGEAAVASIPVQQRY